MLTLQAGDMKQRAVEVDDVELIDLSATTLQCSSRPSVTSCSQQTAVSAVCFEVCLLHRHLANFATAEPQSNAPLILLP